MPKTAKKEGAKEGAHSGRAKKAAARSGHPKSGARLSVKQVKSGIGHAATFRRTLEALGLRHHQQTVQVTDNPSIRGMLFKVRHLVQVTPVEEKN